MISTLRGPNPKIEWGGVAWLAPNGPIYEYSKHAAHGSSLRPNPGEGGLDNSGILP